jgi:hypothetical protein
MSRRNRGRPSITEAQYERRALQVHSVFEQELRVARYDGRAPLKKQAVGRAAVRLGISERSVRRWLAVALAYYVYVPVVDDWSKTVLGAILRARFGGVST